MLAVGGDDHILVVVETREVEKTLGHSVDLLDPRAECRQDAAGKLGRERGSSDLEHLEVLQVGGVLGSSIGEVPREGRHDRSHGRTPATSGRQDRGSIRPRTEHDLPAAEQRAHHSGASQREVVADG
jgi:hypothetical protein